MIEEEKVNGEGDIPSEASKRMDEAIRQIRRMPGSGKEFSTDSFWKTSDERPKKVKNDSDSPDSSRASN